MNPLNSVFLLHHSQLIRVDAWFLDRLLFDNIAGKITYFGPQDEEWELADDQSNPNEECLD